jgi:lactoylglutathione lyase
MATTDPQTSQPLTEPRLTHVALPCADLDRTLDFYTSITPLVVVARNEDVNGRGAWLSNDKQSKDPFVLVVSEFNPDVAAQFGQTPGEPVPILQPFAHIGIEMPRREDVDAVAERARARGCLHWEPRQMPEHIGYICAVKDPDGNVVEFSHNQKVFSTVRRLWGDGDGGE